MDFIKLHALTVLPHCGIEEASSSYMRHPYLVPTPRDECSNFRAMFCCYHSRPGRGHFCFAARSVLVPNNVPFVAVAESGMTQDRVQDDHNIRTGGLVATVLAFSEFTFTILLDPAKPSLPQIP
jgi:hypothetical protein